MAENIPKYDFREAIRNLTLMDDVFMRTVMRDKRCAEYVLRIILERSDLVLDAGFPAQVQKFIELVGKKPDYVHAHAYGTKTTEQVRREMAEKYDIPYTHDAAMKMMGKQAAMGWYKFGGPEEQLTEDLVSFIVNDVSGYLNSEYGFFITHCGYADARLFALSSFNLCRVKDLEALCSDEVKNWVKENNIELITFKDVPKELWK